MRSGKSLEVAELKIGSGTMFVEIYDAHIQHASVGAEADSGIQDLPEGSEPVGARERLTNAIDGLNELIDAAAEVAGEALSRHSPSEIAVELNIGFTGKVDPIPFLVGAEAEAALKVTLTWKGGKKA